MTLVDTGDLTNTGGRLKNVKSYLDEDNFALPMVMDWQILILKLVDYL